MHVFKGTYSGFTLETTHAFPLLHLWWDWSLRLRLHQQIKEFLCTAVQGILTNFQSPGTILALVNWAVPQTLFRHILGVCTFQAACVHPALDSKWFAQWRGKPLNSQAFEHYRGSQLACLGENIWLVAQIETVNNCHTLRPAAVHQLFGPRVSYG